MVIGDDVVVGHAAKLHSCRLEDGCLVGIGAVVLDGATVEAGAIVAAGAVVAPGKRVPAGEMWGGMPARKLRDVHDKDREYMKAAAATTSPPQRLSRPSAISINPLTGGVFEPKYRGVEWGA